MKATKRKKLEAKGWKVGSVEDFLDLTPEEMAYIELKLSLSNSLKERRAKKKAEPGRSLLKLSKPVNLA